MSAAYSAQARPAGDAVPGGTTAGTAAGTDVERLAALFDAPRALLEQARDGRIPLPARLAALADMAASVDALFETHCEEFRNAMEQGESMVLAPTTFSVRHVAPLLEQAAEELNRTLLPLLPGLGMEITRMAQLTPAEQTAIHAIFRRELYPLLIPRAVDPGHPFPRLEHGKLNLLVQLRPPSDDIMMGGSLFAVLMLPAVAPRWIPVPPQPGVSMRRYVWIEDLLEHFAGQFFYGIEVTHVYLFRVLRCPGPDGARPLRGDIVRLDISAPMARGVSVWLANHLRLPAHTVVRNQPPLAMADLHELVALLPAAAPWYRRAAAGVWRFFFGHVR